MSHRFTKTHLWILLGFYLAFTTLSLLVTLPGSLSGHGDKLARSVTASLVSFSGPLTGAVARGFQSCCLEFSLRLLPYCGSVLGLGLLFQFIPLRFGRFEHGLRLTTWTIGLLGWFGGVLISFAHALG